MLPCSDKRQTKDFDWGYSVTGTVPQTDIGFNLQASLLILSTTKRFQSIAEGALPCSAPPTRALGLNARDGGKFVFLGIVNRVILVVVLCFGVLGF